MLFSRFFSWQGLPWTLTASRESQISNDDTRGIPFFGQSANPGYRFFPAANIAL
jgi:hypothetical protein